MERKEFTRRHLPHFQTPGQAYFITWSLKDAIPPKAMIVYTERLKHLHAELESAQKSNADENHIIRIKMELTLTRKKYIKAFDDLLDLQSENLIGLTKTDLTKVLIDTLCYWHGKRLENYAICIMSNHVHWVFRLFDRNENGDPNYLQDILQSVKRFSANKINQIEKRKGTIWHNESFDTTIRDDFHLHNAIDYTLNNPVKAGLVKNWWEWNGTKYF